MCDPKKKKKRKKKVKKKKKVTLILFIEWGNREKVPDGRTSEQSPTAQPCLLGRTGTEARIKGIESRVRRGCIITRVEVKGVRGETTGVVSGPAVEI